MSKLYVYESNIKIGNERIQKLFALKECKLSHVLEKFAQILEWGFIGFAFYANTHYIHSKLFAIFIFLLGLGLLMSLSLKKYQLTKEEFINKINEITESEKNGTNKIRK